jgi:hypothetical protein
VEKLIRDVKLISEGGLIWNLEGCLRSIGNIILKNIIFPYMNNWNLKNLETINLSNNELKALPCEFGSKWSKLTSIDLNNNDLTTIPNDFGTKWSKLTSIYLYQNGLTTIPNDLELSGLN